MGSGARIQRVLDKALTGQSVAISVLGGSGICLFPSSFYTPKLTKPPVSACHGAGDDPISPHATHPASSSGGTSSFPIQLQN